VAEVFARIRVNQHSLHKWIKVYGMPKPESQAQAAQAEELRRLKAQLKRVTEERDILKKGRRVLCPAVQVRDAFIKAHEAQHSVRRMRKVMQVPPPWIRSKLF
jgi:transposase-like protein